MAVPDDVVVKVFVAVVVAVQAVQVVHGAPLLQDSLGHPFPSHQELQSPPDVQALEDPKGPQSPPNGPYSLLPATHELGNGEPVLLVAEKVTSGAAVMVTPTSAQSCAMF
jgi:hypothetical protein